MVWGWGLRVWVDSRFAPREEYCGEAPVLARFLEGLGFAIWALGFGGHGFGPFASSSQAVVRALSFRLKSLKSVKVFPLRSEAVPVIGFWV